MVRPEAPAHREPNRPVPLFNTVPPNTQSLVSEHRVKYLAPLEYRNVPADVDIWFSSVKGASLAISYLVSDPVTNKPCIKAETTLAFVDGATGALQRVNRRAARTAAPAHRCLGLCLAGPSR